jgi:hypothetical protein
VLAFSADLAYFVALVGGDLLLPAMAFITLYTVVLAVRDGVRADNR